MRSIACILLLVAVAVSGCADDDGEDGTPLEDEQVPDPPMPPEAIEETGAFAAGTDPFNFVNNEPCSQSVSTCFFVPFSLDAPFTVDPLLTWQFPGNDLDLYLYTAAGEEVSREGINNIDDVASFTATSHDMPPTPLPAGDYEFRIVVWAGVSDAWTLTATFE